MRALALAAAIVVGAFIVGQPDTTVPQCPEDAVLVGSGDFNAGRYSAYECGPALDDFEGV